MCMKQSSRYTALLLAIAFGIAGIVWSEIREQRANASLHFHGLISNDGTNGTADNTTEGGNFTAATSMVNSRDSYRCLRTKNLTSAAMTVYFLSEAGDVPPLVGGGAATAAPLTPNTTAGIATNATSSTSPAGTNATTANEPPSSSPAPTTHTSYFSNLVSDQHSVFTCNPCDPAGLAAANVSRRKFLFFRCGVHPDMFPDAHPCCCGERVGQVPDLACPIFSLKLAWEDIVAFTMAVSGATTALVLLFAEVLFCAECLVGDDDVGTGLRLLRKKGSGGQLGKAV